MTAGIQPSGGGSLGSERARPSHDVASIMYAPYLPLRERHEIDGWALVPAAGLRESDVANELAARAATGLSRLYGLENQATKLGAFVFRGDVGIGHEIDGDDVRLM